MRLTRAKWRGAAGEWIYSPTWAVDMITPKGERKSILAFQEKRASEEFGRKLEDLRDLKLAGKRPDAAMRLWLDTLPPKIMERLREHGFVDSETAASAMMLTDHLEEYRSALQAKGGSDQHVRQELQKIKKMFTGCGFTLMADLDAGRVQQWLADRRAEGMGLSTSNSYLVAAKAFCQWGYKTRRLTEHPLRHLDKVNAKVGLRKKRRPLTIEELGRLFTATEASQRLHRGMAGKDRALVYRMAVETGLRWSELRSLIRASFNLTAKTPTVTIDAKDEKAGRGATLPLRPDLVQRLKNYFKEHPAVPGSRAFPMPEDNCGAEMIQRDLFETGDTPKMATEKKARGEEPISPIPYEDDLGRTLDFHALRHTFGTLLAQGGVHPKVAQDLMRHSTINLTMGLYTHTTLRDHAAALDKLPPLPNATPHADEEPGAATVTA